MWPMILLMIVMSRLPGSHSRSTVLIQMKYYDVAATDSCVGCKQFRIGSRAIADSVTRRAVEACVQ